MTTRTKFLDSTLIKKGALCGIALIGATALTPAVRAETLEVWSRSGPQAAATYQALFNAFTAATGIEVNYLATVEFETQLRARASARDLPDVLIYDQSSMAAYANTGLIVPVNPSEIEGNAHLSDVSWNSVRMANGDYYGVPFSQHPQILFVRRDWREAVGMEVPTTHDELLELARAFATGDPDGNGINGDTYGMAVPGTTDRGFFAWWLYSVLAQRGASYVDGANGKYRVTIDEPEGIAAVEWLQNTIFCAEPSLAQPGALTNASATPFFAQGHAGIMQTGPYAFPNLDNAPGADVYEVIFAPAGPGGSNALEERTSIYFGATSTLPEAQKRLAEFMISAEGQTIGMTAPGQPVVRLPVNTTLDAVAIYGDDRWAVAVEQLAHSDLMPSDIDFTGARLEIAESFQAIFSRCNDDIEGQVRALAERIAAELQLQDALQ
jgi:multiple sugar transport system substrate-binding protein